MSSSTATNEHGSSRFEAEGRALAEALGEARGNLAAAARRLGVARSTLCRRMERHAVRAPGGGYKHSGIGRENHKMMLSHYQNVKNLLVSYDPKPMGFF